MWHRRRCGGARSHHFRVELTKIVVLITTRFGFWQWDFASKLKVYGIFWGFLPHKNSSSKLIFNRCELHDISIHLLELKTFRLLCKRALSAENSLKIYRSKLVVSHWKFHPLVPAYWKVIKNSISSSMTSSSVEDNWRTVCLSLRTRPHCLIQFSTRITISIFFSVDGFASLATHMQMVDSTFSKSINFLALYF